MVDGFIKYWGRKDLEWVQPAKRVYNLNGLRISISPEIGFILNGIEYHVKLFLKSKETLDRKHADIVTNLMEQGLRKKAGDNVVFAVMDVKRGKLYEYRGENPRIPILLAGEAAGFLNAWNAL